MLALIDTVIGFTVILLLLSFLIKSLTSVVKNHVQYYSQNLRVELERLLRPLAGAGLQKLESTFAGIDWRNVGEEIFDNKTLEPLLKKIDPSLDLKDLEARVAVHKSALKFAWDKRMKNLSLVCGTALCLLLNINALTIWQTLYEDVEVRAKFSSDEYVAEVLERAKQFDEAQPSGMAETAPPALPADSPTEVEPPDPSQPPEGKPGPVGVDDPDEAVAEAEDQNKKKRDELTEERTKWLAELEQFQKDVDFGIGDIWTMEKATLVDVLFAFIGSLLTGILASVGAPYLHDLLRALASFRKKPAGETAP